MAVLIHIAELEKDIPTIRHYTKEIALEDKGNIEYYEKWKKTYTEKQWQEVIEKEIKELEDDYNQKREKNQVIGIIQSFLLHYSLFTNKKISMKSFGIM